MNENGKDVMEICSVSEVSLVRKIEQSQSVASSRLDDKSTPSVRKIYNHASSSISDVTTDPPGKREVGSTGEADKDEVVQTISGRIAAIIEEDGHVAGRRCCKQQ